MYVIKEARDESSFFCEENLFEVQVRATWQGFAGDLRKPKAQAASRLGWVQAVPDPGR
jgi:hypothetical protein